MDIDAETWASIERNIETARYLDSIGPRDPPKELVMTAENFAAQKAKAQVLIDRLRARIYIDGPRGE